MTSSKVSCLGRLTKPWAACRRVPKMQFRTTTLPTSVQSSSTEASNDTHEDRTHSPTEVGVHVAFADSFCGGPDKLREKRFRTGLPQRKQRQRMSLQRVVSSPTCVGRESGGREGRRGEGGYHEAHTNKTTVQQDAPRDVGPSAIGRKAQACRILE